MPVNEPKPTRLDIFTADVVKISGCSESTAARKIKQCRDAIGKKDHQVLTIREFCDYYGYEYKDIILILGLV